MLRRYLSSIPRSQAAGRRRQCRKHVKEHLAVTRGSQVSVEEAVRAAQNLAQLVGVREVSVVHEVDAERRVDEEWLRVGR